MEWRGMGSVEGYGSGECGGIWEWGVWRDIGVGSVEGYRSGECGGIWEYGRKFLCVTVKEYGHRCGNMRI